MVFQVKITDSKLDTYWYANKIGEVFSVRYPLERNERWDGALEVMDSDSCGCFTGCFTGRFIDESDCVIVYPVTMTPYPYIQGKLFKASDSSDHKTLMLNIADGTAFSKAMEEKGPLEVSIKKWKFIIKMIWTYGKYVYDGGVYTCGLCRVHNNRSSDEECDCCPVYKNTGLRFCGGTPFMKYADLYKGDTSVDPDFAFKYAHEELEFLKGLRNER